MPLQTWRQNDFDNHFKELGIKKGDKICVHSKLLSFGYIENGSSKRKGSSLKVTLSFHPQQPPTPRTWGHRHTHFTYNKS